MGRRSSRVRFSEAMLPPANPPTPPPAEAMRCISSVEGLHSDLAIRARSLSIPQRASVASISSVASDPFALQGYASPLSRLSLVPNSKDDAFDPQPLPYPKKPSQLTRLSTDTRTTPSSSSSTGPSSPALRDILTRPSLGPTPRHSYALSLRDSQTSFASMASTMISSELNTSTGSSFSVGPPQSATFNSAFQLEPIADEEQQHPPRIIRERWEHVDLGPSPRSGPSPVVKQEEAMGHSAVQESEQRGTEDSVLQQDKCLPQRVERMDSIDLLPALDESPEEDFLPTVHSRSSTLSLTFDFPLPPIRTPSLSVSTHQTSESAFEAESMLLDALICHEDLPLSRTRLPTMDTMTAAESECGIQADDDNTILLDTPRPDEIVMEMDTRRPDQTVTEMAIRPPSPQLKELMRQTARTRKLRKRTTGCDDEEDSDLGEYTAWPENPS